MVKDCRLNMAMLTSLTVIGVTAMLLQVGEPASSDSAGIIFDRVRIAHEWAGRLFLVTMVIHTIRHRKWLMGIGRKLLRPLPGRTRLQFVLVVTMLAPSITLLASGHEVTRPVASLAVAPSVEQDGLGLGRSRFTFMGSRLAAELRPAGIVEHGPHIAAGIILIVTTGLHLSFNWGWIRTAARRILPAR